MRHTRLLSLLLAGFAWAAVAVADAVAAATADDAEGPAREPWTGSRLVGTPDPPPPFLEERVFPRVDLDHALEIVAEPGTGRWIALERRGRILAWDAADPEAAAEEILDLKAARPDLDFLYGIAHHPRFAENGEFFLTYTVGRGLPEGTRLSRFRLGGDGRFDPASEEVLLTWLSGGHNGAHLRFGPDGMLYVSTGDATAPSPPDALNAGQDLTNLLSAILRIDVDRRGEGGAPYRIPPDNPFLGLEVPDVEGGTGPARGEVWAFGFRNPWKMAFDPEDGRLWCGDVGWERWESVHLVERGGNYGWSAYEATAPVRADAPRPPVPVSPPVVAHSHDEAASITMGHVYGGSEFPELRGALVYGDYETGNVWALRHDGQRVASHELIARTGLRIVAFGRDEGGEIVFLHYGQPSSVHRLRRHPRAGQESDFPRLLSETGIFSDTAAQEPAAGVVAYKPAAPLHQGEVEVRRWIALPGASRLGSRLQMRGETLVRRHLEWPEGAVLARSLGLPGPHGEAVPRWVETQLLHYDGRDWHGYAYRWDDEGRDAELVASEGASASVALAAAEAGSEGEGKAGLELERPWRFHARSECLRCHNRWSEHVLGFRPAQLDALQVAALEALGIVDEGFAPQEGEPRLAPPFPKAEHGGGRRGEEAADEGDGGFDGDPGLELRARSWLHANCAHCHRRHGGGSVAMMLNHELPLEEAGLLGAPPEQGDFGIAGASLIDPGRPWASVLCLRLATTGAGHMPAIGMREVDVAGLRLVEDWIASLAPTDAPPEDAPPTAWSAGLARRALLSVEGAMQLRRAIDDGLIGAELREEVLESAWASPLPLVRDLFERFLPADRRVATLGPAPDADAILALDGDLGRGAALLRPEGRMATCLACHRLGGEGREFGPDLDGVGSRYDRERLLGKLLSPSLEIAEGYAAATVETVAGEALTGLVRRRDAEGLALKTPDGALRWIPAAELATETPLPASLMPEGLLHALTAQEAADLLDYLAGLE